MIKDIEEVIREMYIYDTSERLKDVLRKWANSIIDECAGNFECTMEENEPIDSYGPNDISDGRFHPVLMRGSIFAVKEQIK